MKMTTSIRSPEDSNSCNNDCVQADKTTCDAVISIPTPPYPKLQDLSHPIYHTHCSKSSFFVQKFNFDFPRKIVELFWVKNRENAAVLDFDFTSKIVKKKKMGEKLVKMLGICTFWYLTSLISREKL